MRLFYSHVTTQMELKQKLKMYSSECLLIITLMPENEFLFLEKKAGKD